MSDYFDFDVDLYQADLVLLRDFDISELSPDMLEAMYADTDELGMMETESVQSRTPVLTGALKSSEYYEANHDKSNPLLARIYAETGPQTDQWGRVYAPYVEGGLMGLPSHTISHPSTMFAQIMSTDLPQIQEWAKKNLKQGKVNFVARRQ